MGFNYLQTDDRDDYFASLGFNGNKKTVLGYSLISPSGQIIFEQAPYYKLMTYCKNNYLPNGNSGKKIWRNTLISKGYKVIKIVEQ